MDEGDAGLPPLSLPWRVGSTAVMGFIGGVSRLFMTGPNSTKAYGMEKFMDMLDDREDIERRRRGLITGMQPSLPDLRSSMLTKCSAVSNHICVYVRITPLRGTPTEAQRLILGRHEIELTTL